MPWEGYNYEDAILVSERMVSDDLYTSVHKENYEIESRQTKLGPEEITREIPNISEESLNNLDEMGIIRIGAFVEILPGKEGMVHISQLSEARVERVEDVVRQGDEVTVRVREIDSRGRINLTLRGVGQNNGMSYPEPTPTPVAPLN